MDLKAFLLGSHLQQSKSTPTKVKILSFVCEQHLISPGNIDTQAFGGKEKDLQRL